MKGARAGRGRGASDVGWRRLLQSFMPADFDDAHVPTTLEHVARLAVTPTSTTFRLAADQGVVIRHVSAADRMAAIGFLSSFVTDRADATSRPREQEDVAVSSARDVWHRFDLYHVVFALVVGSNEGDAVPATRQRLVAVGILNSLLTINRLGGPALQLPGINGPDDPERSGPPSPN